MKSATHTLSEQHQHTPASEQDRTTLTTPAAQFVDHRPEAIAQRKFADVIHNSRQLQAQRQATDAIHHSPHMVAQRQQLQGMFGEAAQLQGGPEAEELLQGKFASVQRAEADQNGEPRVNNTGLPDNLKSGIESLSGLSMDAVRVHYNSPQPAQLNALAYAQGTDIHVAPGQEQHLPHEAWHVVQQAQGRVQPTMQMKDGVPVNDDAGLEHETDVMGAKAMGYAVQRQGSAEEELLQGKRDSVQRQGTEEEELLQGKFTRQHRTVRLIQRMAENGNSPVFEDDAQVDPTETLAIRGGDIPHGINAKLIESLPRNSGLKKGDGKKIPTWPIGTWTGISVVSCTEHVEGKKPMVVINVPPGLEIIQCDNDHHAEFKTTVAMSTTDLNKAIKAIKTTGTGDGLVAQLKDV